MKDASAKWHKVHSVWMAATRIKIEAQKYDTEFAKSVVANAATVALSVEGEIDAACRECQRVKSLKPQSRQHIPKSLRNKILLSSNGRCHYCERNIDLDLLEIDHKQPVSKGGTNEESNLVAACPPCNSAKKDKTYEEFKGSK